MTLLRIALSGTLATALFAQEDDHGFKWVGLRAGSLALDSQDNASASPLFGVQGGIVFDKREYGFSVEGFFARPKSNLYRGEKFGHNQVSVTLLRGLSSDSASTFWPYLGVGLGALTVAQDDPAAQAVATRNTAMVHVDFGLLHRPRPHLLWGVEGRWLTTVTTASGRGRQDFQGSLLLGFSWGGPGESPRPASPSPATPAKAPEPPREAPVAKPEPVPAPAAPLPPPTPARPLPRPTPPPPAAAPAPKPIPKAEPPRPAPRSSAPAAVPAAPPPPAPAAAPAPTPSPAAPIPDSDLGQRLEALRTMDMTRAVALGRKRIESSPKGYWTLRLEVADLPSTLKAAVEAFPGRTPDLFVAPIQVRPGKTSYQLFLGTYPTWLEAERAIKSVPAHFLEGGQRPRPFLVNAIPSLGKR